MFRLYSIEKRFRCVYFIFFRCLLVCSRLCWRNDAHKMRHTFSLCRCTHGGLFFIFFIFFPIINVMGFHCYCHSLAAVQLYLMIVIIGSRNSGRVAIFSQTILRNVYHLTKKSKKRPTNWTAEKWFCFHNFYIWWCNFGYVDVFDSLWVDLLTDFSSFLTSTSSFFYINDASVFLCSESIHAFVYRIILLL